MQRSLFMREKLKYFILNKAYDYNRGILENMVVKSGDLCFESRSKAGVGRFMTRIFDSGEREMNWHRLVIRTEGCLDEDLRVTVYSCDRETVRLDGEETTIHNVFADTQLSLDQKLRIFAPMVTKRASGVSDILLHDVSGRYLWLLVEMYSPNDTAAKINDIMIYLPAESWIDKLPQIYRRSDRQSHFLERYLGIFQTFYEELDTEIADISNCFDPECAESDFLEMLSGWLNIKDTRIWSEEQLRILLLKAVRLYRMRGTKEGLSELLELYLGEKPFIIEGFAVRQQTENKNEMALSAMYGSSPYTVTVLVKPGHDLEIVRRLALEMLPASVELKLAELDPFIFLDNYAYLGVNSSLGNYRPAALDGRSQLSLSTLGAAPRDKDHDKGGIPGDNG